MRKTDNDDKNAVVMVAHPHRFPPFPFIRFSGSKGPSRRKDNDCGDGTNGFDSGDKGKGVVRIQDTVTDCVPTIDKAQAIPGPSTCPLARISLAKLLSNDEAELRLLLETCQKLGAFYLDLQRTDMGRDILNDVDELFSLGEQFFSLSDAEKEKYDMGQFGGYYG